MGFHFGPDFHASSDPQIHGFTVVLRAAQWFFILVLIFMYLQINRIHDFRGTLIAAECVFIVVQLEQLKGFLIWS